MRKIPLVFTALCLVLLCLGAAANASAAALKTYKNSIGMEFVLIPAGSLLPRVIGKNAFGEDVVGKFVISKPFYLGKYEVTQVQWEAVMGNNPSKFKGLNNPVENVSWNDAQEFIKRMNTKEGHNRYRLPTGMEWKLASKGGTSTTFFWGNDYESCELYAWLNRNSGDATHPVGQKKPNQYGLYDIYGNVSEWGQDWWYNLGRNLPKGKEIKDYCGPASGSHRINQGGSWEHPFGGYLTGDPDGDKPGYRSGNLGFRLALTPR